MKMKYKIYGMGRDGNLPEPDGEPGSPDPDGDGENSENRGRGPGPGIPGIAKPGPGGSPIHPVPGNIYFFIYIKYNI